MPQQLDKQCENKISLKEDEISTSMVAKSIKLKYIIDVGMLISFLACFITGIIKYPGLLLFFGIKPISLPLYQISLIHDRSGVLLGLFVLAHLIFNFGWMVSVTKKILKK